ncbi:hypothetical protein UFOVP257_23 [uncultured Caudovirales phage]|uniref:Uncharacterized protein n=1 Tax=uncultured Caudovirales phage TaxID=2100421 RepID=A0A6J5LIN8_9CAUD|nr:hypothetical protein UFOVP257_23 [uncultured Caudovirales phage]
MQKIEKQFRKDYTGQDVNLVGLYLNTEWRYQKEFIDNPFENLVPLKEYALVIGNGPSRLEFDLKQFLPFKSGTFDNEWHSIHAKKKFYTYGCNALYRDFKTDFLVATGKELITEISESGYCDDNIVYANDWALPQYTGQFHHIPQNPGFNSGTIAAYLAAFDGHKKVFLMGFDGNDTPGINWNIYNGTNAYPTKEEHTLEEFWVRTLKIVMDTYGDTEFVRVAPTDTFRTPETWKYCLNFRTISFRQFVLEADL